MSKNPPKIRVIDGRASASSGSADEEQRPHEPRDLEQVFRRYAPYVARIAQLLMGHGHDIDDVVQDVFLDAHRGLRALRDAGATRAWLATVTVRKARARLRRRTLVRWLGFDSSPNIATILDPSASAESRAWLVAIYRILDTLPPQARIAWLMHRVEGESLEAVAEVCGCSRATAHRRVQEAQAALEKGLEDVAS